MYSGIGHTISRVGTNVTTKNTSLHVIMFSFTLYNKCGRRATDDSVCISTTFLVECAKEMCVSVCDENCVKFASERAVRLQSDILGNVLICILDKNIKAMLIFAC